MAKKMAVVSVVNHTKNAKWFKYLSYTQLQVFNITEIQVIKNALKCVTVRWEISTLLYYNLSEALNLLGF